MGLRSSDGMLFSSDMCSFEPTCTSNRMVWRVITDKFPE